MIRTIFPTGSSGPNRFPATVCPRRTTFEAASVSAGEKFLPETIFQSRISRYSGQTPWTIVLQFWFPYTTGALVRIDGVAKRTEGSSFPIARASPIVRVGTPPNPERNPPEVVLPGRTRRRFEPTEEIWAEILRFAPSPMATMTMTAPTPMIIPSIVRAERILFARRERNATFPADQRFMRTPVPAGRRSAGGSTRAGPPRSARPGNGSPAGRIRRFPARA